MAATSIKINITLTQPSQPAIPEQEARNAEQLLQHKEAANKKLGITLLKGLIEKFPAGTYTFLVNKIHLRSLFSLLRKAKLYALDLSENNLSTLPKNFAQLTMLRELNLCRTYLDAFPREILNFKALEVLDLSKNYYETGNRYYPDEIKLALPEELVQLTQLKSLNLAGNSYYQKELPKGMAKLVQLESLNLNGNRLKGIPAFVYKLERLKTLGLANCWLSNDSNQKKVSRQLDRLSTIETLEKLDVSMNGNHLTRLPRNWVNLQNLTDLNLRGNAINELPEELCNLPCLKHINLANNCLEQLPPNS